MKTALLRLVLLVRCAVDLVFAWRIHQATPTTFAALLRSFEPFAVTDGMLALVLAPLVLAELWGAGASVVAVVDGLIRVGWAAMIRWGPGIPYFAVTIVLFSGLLATLGALVGVFQLAVAVQLRRRTGSTASGLALGVLGGVFILLAVVSFQFDVSPTTTGKVLLGSTLLQALAFAVMAISARPGRPQIATRPYRSSELPRPGS